MTLSTWDNNKARVLA